MYMYPTVLWFPYKEENICTIHYTLHGGICEGKGDKANIQTSLPKDVAGSQTSHTQDLWYYLIFYTDDIIFCGFSEIQLMRKFLRDIQLQSLEFPSDNNDFKELLVDMKNGTIGETIKDLQSDEITPCPPIKRIALDKEDSLDLHMMYKSLYPQGKLDCLRLCDSFTRLTVSGILYQSLNNVGVIAKWFNGEVRPGRVCRFLNHHVVMKEQNGKRKKVSHVLAEVKWFKKHPEQNFYPKPFEVWSTQKEHYIQIYLTSQ